MKSRQGRAPRVRRDARPAAGERRRGPGGRRPRVITGRTRLAAVIGHPVEHSLSPALHNAGFASLGVDWAYVAFDVAPGGAVAALAGMRALGIGGLSVTMPHKEDVAAAVDVLDPAAAALRSVNTVVALRDGRLAGHSTDGDGFVASLGAEGVAIAGRAVCVLGAGGAARSIVEALARNGAAQVVVVNRSAERAAGRRGTGWSQSVAPGRSTTSSPPTSWSTRRRWGWGRATAARPLSCCTAIRSSPTSSTTHGAQPCSTSPSRRARRRSTASACSSTRPPCSRRCGPAARRMSRRCAPRPSASWPLARPAAR